MQVLIFFTIFTAIAQAIHITHDEKATSYQSIHFQHFHAVPTYIRKEDKHLLEHPLPAGKTVSKIKIRHGDKHDPGYAYVTGHDDSHVYQPESPADYGSEYAGQHENVKYTDIGYQKSLGHQEQEEAGAGQEAYGASQLEHEGYPAQDQGQDYSQYHQQLYQQGQQEDAEKQYAAYAAQTLSRYHLAAPEQEQEPNQAYSGYYDYKQLAAASAAGLGQYQTVEETSEHDKSK